MTLVDIDQTKIDPFNLTLISITNNGKENFVRHSKGIYIHVGFNLHLRLDDSWDTFKCMPKKLSKEEEKAYWEWQSYMPNNLPKNGVCDSVEQFVEKYQPPLDTDPSTDYVAGPHEIAQVRRVV